MAIANCLYHWLISNASACWRAGSHSCSSYLFHAIRWGMSASGTIPSPCSHVLFQFSSVTQPLLQQGRRGRVGRSNPEETAPCLYTRGQRNIKSTVLLQCHYKYLIRLKTNCFLTSSSLLNVLSVTQSCWKDERNSILRQEVLMALPRRK